MKTMSDLYTQSLLLFITVVCCLTPATDEMDKDSTLAEQLRRLI